MSLTPQDDDRRLNSPPLQGTGRGWGFSAQRHGELQERAAGMRRQPTGPEKRIWRHLSRSQPGGFKFRRQAMIGTYIADFLCPAVRSIVEIDGYTHVGSVTNTDVMINSDGVLRHLLSTLQALPMARTPHPDRSPEGEGFEG